MPHEGEGLKAILKGSSNLPNSASNKVQKPLPEGMSYAWKPSDEQTRQDIIQAKSRDYTIRQAVASEGMALERSRKAQVERKPPSIGERLGNRLKELLGVIIPDAGAADLQDMLGVKGHSGVSMKTATEIRRLDEELSQQPKEEPKPTNRENKGKTQKEVYKETFGESAAERRAAAQEEQRKKLFKARQGK